MKSTGIVRKMDDLGRIVIPKEIRRNSNINVGDPLEIFMDGKQIILQPYKPGCHECGTVDVRLYGKNTHVCYVCIDRLNDERIFNEGKHD